MNEFDLRNYLYNNPLMEKKEDSKKGNKEMQKRMKGAIEDDADHIEKLEKDIKANKKKLSKLKKDEPMDVNESKSVDELQANRKGDKGDTKIEKLSDNEMDPKDDKKLTKEGLKDMIREKITSILNEDEEIYEGNSPYYEDVTEEVEEKVVDDTKVDVDKETDIEADIKKDVKIDDVEDEEDLDIKGSVSGQSAEDSGIEALLKKAREMAQEQGQPKLARNISNSIIQHERIKADEESGED
jgi:hypothetical protein